MGNYSEIERLFREVLDEKDKFRILGAATRICEQLGKTDFKPEWQLSKEEYIDTTYNLLCMYSITFNEIIRNRIEKQMHSVLNCISDN